MSMTEERVGEGREGGEGKGRRGEERKAEEGNQGRVSGA